MINALEPCAVLFDRYCNWLKRVKFAGKYGRWSDAEADDAACPCCPVEADCGFGFLVPDVELLGTGVTDLGFGFGLGIDDDETLYLGWGLVSTSLTCCKLKCGCTKGTEDTEFGFLNKPKKLNDWTDTTTHRSVSNKGHLKLQFRKEIY